MQRSQDFDFITPAEEVGLQLCGLLSVFCHEDFFSLDHMPVPAGHKADY